MAECARQLVLEPYLVLLKRRAFKFSLRPEFENLLQLLFGAYKSAAIVFRVVFIMVCLSSSKISHIFTSELSLLSVFFHYSHFPYSLLFSLQIVTSLTSSRTLTSQNLTYSHFKIVTLNKLIRTTISFNKKSKIQIFLSIKIQKSKSSLTALLLTLSFPLLFQRIIFQ